MSALPANIPSSTALQEVPWLRSSYSTGQNNCVETARPGPGPLAGAVAVRDSKNTSGPALLFPPEAWEGFVATIR